MSSTGYQKQTIGSGLQERANAGEPDSEEEWCESHVQHSQLCIFVAVNITLTHKASRERKWVDVKNLFQSCRRTMFIAHYAKMKY